jgi:hypothetical protein
VEASEQNQKKLKKMVQDGFLKFLDKNDLLFWMAHGSMEEFPKLNTVFYRGHLPIGLHIFIEGTVVVEYISGKKVSPISLVEPVMLGLNHVKDFSTNRYTVRTLTDSKCIFVPRSLLNHIIYDQKKIAI